MGLGSAGTQGVMMSSSHDRIGGITKMAPVLTQFIVTYDYCNELIDELIRDGFDSQAERLQDIAETLRSSMARLEALSLSIYLVDEEKIES